MVGLRKIMYRSHPTAPVTSKILESILHVARGRNRALRISGILVYKNKNFVQLLEGSPLSVEMVMESIRRDDRHQNLEVLIDETYDKTERSFPTWSMGLVMPESLANVRPDVFCVEILDSASEKDPVACRLRDVVAAL